VISRINNLTERSQPGWGKMNAGQMLAHCNVSYEYVYDGIHKKPNPVLRFILTKLVKQKVVSETPFKHSERTAPEFIIKGERDFDKEKQRLISYIHKTQALGGAHFDGKESHSFGKLSTAEWNNMFYKHLDHHLDQFAV
jgi:hypothetical protein